MRKTVIVLFFLFVSSFACAHEESDTWKATHLEDEKKRLSAEYEKKAKELSEITMKIHDIETQLRDLKLGTRQTHNPHY